MSTTQTGQRLKAEQEAEDGIAIVQQLRKESMNEPPPPQPTPRTDAEADRLGYKFLPNRSIVGVAFARQLERELATERASRERAEASAHQSRCNAESSDNWRRACAEAEQRAESAEREVAELKEHLKNVLDDAHAQWMESPHITAATKYLAQLSAPAKEEGK